MDKNYIKIAAITGSLLFIIIILVTCFSGTERYYEDCNYDGSFAPEGLNEILDMDGNKRYYKIVTYGGRAISMSFHDYDGTIRPFGDKNLSKIEYFYDDDGELNRIVRYDSDLKQISSEKIKVTKKKKKK
ncbi:MAG TPA: hypothetical protein PKK26_19055 [Candidatus Wallbacteria bacterium]|nr:hypothetical protein [Candidatus Wallbacteria bacterium]